MNDAPVLDYRQKATTLLESLGPTPASQLTALGIRGRPRMVYSCPIKKYLDIHFPDCMAAVMGKSVLLLPPGKCGVCVPLPVSCRAFIDAFDAGEYPELIEA